MKVSIIGAGNVGSALAERILAHDLADTVLLDIVEGLAKAKAFDLKDAAPIMGYEKKILGTNSYEDIIDSQVVVITAGFPRHPGMSREDLIYKNLGIIKSVLKAIKEVSPSSVLIMVTNPLDVMTYLAYKEMQCTRCKILGMAGNLDTARFKVFLSHQLNVPLEEIEAFVLGSHGDAMVPLISKTLIDGKPLKSMLQKDKIAEIVNLTKTRGGQIVSLLKSGSAYFSPSAACLEILRAIINNEKKTIPCSCILNGEYGISDCSIGVPAKIGKEGIEEIAEWELPEEEISALRKSAKMVRDILEKYKL